MAIEEILNIFLPGVVCIYVYDSLAMKRYPLQTYTVAGAIIGAIIKFVVDWLNGIALKHIQTDIPVFIAYIVFAVIVGLLFYLIKNSFLLRKVLADTLHVDSADNFWKMHIDFKENTLAMLYLSSGEIVSGLVQSVDDEYITLRNHTTVKELYNETASKAMETPNRGTLMCIPIKNIVRFEIGYSNKSKYKDIVFRK